MKDVPYNINVSYVSCKFVEEICVIISFISPNDIDFKLPNSLLFNQQILSIGLYIFDGLCIFI